MTVGPNELSSGTIFPCHSLTTASRELPAKSIVHRNRAAQTGRLFCPTLHKSNYKQFFLHSEVLGNQQFFKAGMTLSCLMVVSLDWVPVLKQGVLYLVQKVEFVYWHRFGFMPVGAPMGPFASDLWSQGGCGIGGDRVQWGLAALPWGLVFSWGKACKAAPLASWFLSGSAEPVLMTSRPHKEFSSSLLSNKWEDLDQLILFLQDSFFHCLYREKTIGLFLSSFSSVLLLAL